MDLDVAEVLDYRSLPDGMPVLLDERMRPIEPVCGWFRASAYAGKKPETMRAYAYTVRRLAEFLVRRGIDLLSVTEGIWSPTAGRGPRWRTAWSMT
ncbi:hypothetical protein ABT299_11530 [Spirillospora sp. NPDC000708]